MSWTDSQIKCLITFYSSVLVSGARNFATGVKNWRQKPTPVSGACVISIRHSGVRYTTPLLSHIKLLLPRCAHLRRVMKVLVGYHQSPLISTHS